MKEPLTAAQLAAIAKATSPNKGVEDALNRIADAIYLLAQATASQYAHDEEEEAGPTSLSER